MPTFNQSIGWRSGKPPWRERNSGAKSAMVRKFSRLTTALMRTWAESGRLTWWFSVGPATNCSTFHPLPGFWKNPLWFQRMPSSLPSNIFPRSRKEKLPSWPEGSERRITGINSGSRCLIQATPSRFYGNSASDCTIPRQNSMVVSAPSMIRLSNCRAKRRNIMARKRKPIIVIHDEVWQSDAFGKLSATAIRALLWFYSKRRISVTKNPRRSDAVKILNNGEITFTYSEAEKAGISRSNFMRAIDRLIEVGFLDVNKTGAGQFKEATLYALSERWRRYGKEGFVKKERNPHGRGSTGFQKGHRPIGRQGAHGTL